MGLQPYVKEAWIEYAIGTLVVALRMYARIWKLGGIRKLLADDYLMFFAWIVFTVEAVIWHNLGKGSAIATNAKTPPDLLEKARLAKKFNFAVWPVYVTLIWSLKGCLLIFYNRLVGKTAGRMRKFIVLAGWLIGLTWVGCILEVMLHCLPIWKTWISYPVTAPHCRAGIDNFLVVGMLNLLTDLVLLAIPIPILYRLRIPLRRKLVIGALLCSGVFIIIATILRNVSAWEATKGNTGNWNWNEVLGWAVRENFIALVVVNIPCIKPLFSSSQWIKTLTSKKGSQGQSSGTGGSSDGNGTASSSKDPVGSKSFFRRYSPKTLRSLGRTTHDKDDGYQVTVQEKRLSDESRTKITADPSIPKQAHLSRKRRSDDDLESGLAHAGANEQSLTIHKDTQFNTHVESLPTEGSRRYPDNYLINEGLENQVKAEAS